MADYSNGVDRKCPICNANVPKHCVEFCSKKCWSESRHITKTCPECKKQFQTLKCFSMQKFCSEFCSKHSSKKDITKWTKIQCSNCTKEFEIRKKRLKNKNLFCCLDCYNEFLSKIKSKYACVSCGASFYKKNDNEVFFCSDECKTHGIKNFAINLKKDHYHYKNGIYVTKNGKRLHYDSSWEFIRMKQLDYDLTIEHWDRCSYVIKYIDPILQLEKLYYPDFEIQYYNGRKIIEELKGRFDEIANAKRLAAIDFCSKIGYEYRLIDKLSDFKEDVEICLEESYNELGVSHRPSYEYIWMNLANTLSKRSTCSRLQVGAVIVSYDNTKVLAIGYNGNIPGGINDCDSYEAGRCGCIHAESNAIAKLTEGARGSTMYVTTAPCHQCAKLIITSNISKLIYLESYRNMSGVKLLRDNNVEVTKYSDVILHKESLAMINNESSNKY